MVAKWKGIWVWGSQKAVPTCEGWSEEDKRRLEHLTSQHITSDAMAVGRHPEVIKHQISNVITKMSKVEEIELKMKLEQIEDEGDSPEPISVRPNLNTEIFPTNPGE